MANKINALSWYKMKMKELAVEGGYVKSISIMLTYGTDNDKMGLDWLFNYYSPNDNEVSSIDDEIEFAEDGTPLHDITIWVKEI